MALLRGVWVQGRRVRFWSYRATDRRALLLFCSGLRVETSVLLAHPVHFSTSPDPAFPLLHIHIVLIHGQHQYDQHDSYWPGTPCIQSPSEVGEESTHTKLPAATVSACLLRAAVFTQEPRAPHHIHADRTPNLG